MSNTANELWGDDWEAEVATVASPSVGVVGGGSKRENQLTTDDLFDIAANGVAGHDEIVNGVLSQYGYNREFLLEVAGKDYQSYIDDSDLLRQFCATLMEDQTIRSGGVPFRFTSKANCRRCGVVAINPELAGQALENCPFCRKPQRDHFFRPYVHPVFRKPGVDPVTYGSPRNTCNTM